MSPHGGIRPSIKAVTQTDEVSMSIAALSAQTSADDSSPTSNRGDDIHELLTVEDVAAILKVSKSWVYEHTRSRNIPRAERLPHVKVGKYVRFEPRALRGYLEKHQCRIS
jgi:excisionase family DNA binding protein